MIYICTFSSFSYSYTVGDILYRYRNGAYWACATDADCGIFPRVFRSVVKNRWLFGQTNPALGRKSSAPTGTIIGAADTLGILFFSVFNLTDVICGVIKTLETGLSWYNVSIELLEWLAFKVWSKRVIDTLPIYISSVTETLAQSHGSFHSHECK